MNVVIQKHPEGCGLACAAMLADRTYDEITEIAAHLNIHAGDKELYGTTEPIRRLLFKLDIPVAPTEKPFDNWNRLPDRALLATKWHLEQGKPFWHWVVFVRDDTGPAVLDPAAFLKMNRRKDIAAIKPKWFIEIL